MSRENNKIDVLGRVYPCGAEVMHADARGPGSRLIGGRGWNEGLSLSLPFVNVAATFNVRRSSDGSASLAQ